jgi:hypothetical protein
MKSVLKFALALSIFASTVAASAAPVTSFPPKTIKVTKRWQLHDGCHSRYAQMRGKPCH